MFQTFLGDFNLQKLPSRSLQTLWEWKNRVLLEEYYIFNVAIPLEVEREQSYESAKWVNTLETAPGALTRPALGPLLGRFLPLFTDCSDFLGRLQPSNTIIQRTPNALGVEESSSPLEVEREQSYGITLLSFDL